MARELTVRADDVFCRPRGLFHSARSTDEPSLHIALGLIGKTWIKEGLLVCSAEPTRYRRTQQRYREATEARRR